VHVLFGDSEAVNFNLQRNMQCGYKVPGTNLLQAYSFLRGVTFRVLPLSSYVAKSGEHGGSSISVVDFWARN
jgi:hypothetical protein